MVSLGDLVRWTGHDGGGLSRRELLYAGSAAVLGATAVAGCDRLSTDPTSDDEERGPEQLGGEAPELARLVEAGRLPPVEERLPENPLVVEPTEQVGTYGGTLRTALIGPHSSYMYCVSAYDNLLRWRQDWTGAPGTDELLPNIAESFDVNDDGTEFTFQLRRGMKWSDGEPFTADDVVFAVEDVFLDKDISPVPLALLTVDDGTASIERVDDYAFRIVFPAPAGLFLQKLATWDGHPLTHLPRHYLEQFHAKYNPDVEALVAEEDAPDWVELFIEKAGPGSNFGHNPDLPTLAPWQLVSGFAEGRVVLERNPYYWKVDSEGNQLPYIDEVVFEMVGDAEVMLLNALNGEIDLEAGPDTRFTSAANKPVLARDRETGDYRFIDVEEVRMNILCVYVNLSHPDATLREVFQNKDFRIGLSHAINRREIIDTTMQRQGEPYQNAPLPDSPFYDEEFATQYLEYDEQLANDHLDQVVPDRDDDGMRLGPDGDRLVFTIEFVATFRPEWGDMLEMIQDYWRGVGVEVRLRNMDITLYGERRLANEHQAGIWHGDGGLDVLLSTGHYFPTTQRSTYASGWGLWYSSKGTEGVEPPDEPRRQMELFDQVKSTVDADEQATLMSEILDIAREQFYGIGIARETEKYFIASNRLRNLPTVMIQGFSYPTPGPTRPEQYFFE